MISVVTPSFNQSKYLSKTIESVVSNSNTVEYIVVDGNSTDGSREIISRWKKLISQIIVEPDQGQADAVAKGFRYSSGDICSYLNSDDFYLPGALEFVEQYFIEHPGVDVIYGHRLFVDEAGHAKKLWVLPPHNSYLMCRWDFIPQETCFWRRSLMHEAGGVDASYQFALDYDLFVRMMKNGKFVRVNKFLAAFRVHSDSKTSRQLDDVGEKEMQRVRVSNNIKLHWWDFIVARIFVYTIRSCSAVAWFFTKRSFFQDKVFSSGK